MIDSFSVEHRFLSNFWPAKVKLDGIEYQTVEHAYQAAKTLDPFLRKPFESIEPGRAKRLGKRLKMRPDWKQVKIPIMKDLLLQKFADPELKQLLLSTGDELLIEGNTWGDTFWGICRSEGSNYLGQILMGIRAILKEGDHSIFDRIPSTLVFGYIGVTFPAVRTMDTIWWILDQTENPVELARTKPPADEFHSFHSGNASHGQYPTWEHWLKQWVLDNEQLLYDPLAWTISNGGAITNVLMINQEVKHAK